MVRAALPDLAAVDPEALKTPITAQQKDKQRQLEQRAHQRKEHHAELLSHAQQIEHLNLIVEKLRCMLFDSRARSSRCSLISGNCKWKRWRRSRSRSRCRPCGISNLMVQLHRVPLSRRCRLERIEHVYILDPTRCHGLGASVNCSCHVKRRAICSKSLCVAPPVNPA